MKARKHFLAVSNQYPSTVFECSGIMQESAEKVKGASVSEEG